MALNFQWLRQCTEIPILLLFFGFLVADPVTTNFVIYRTCYVTMRFNETDCAKLGSKNPDNATQELETLVQPYANTFLMTQNLVGVFLPAMFCLFIGPWSDKHGRKPVLIAAYAGYTISSIVAVVIATTPTLSPWYLLIASIPAVLFGGFSPLLMATLAYITDITTIENRGLRIGIFEGVVAFGMLLGNITSSYIFNFGGYAIVFGIGAVCYFIAFLYCVIVLTETVCTVEQDDTPIYSFSNVSDMLNATFKRREGYTRLILLLSISMAVLFAMGSTSDGTVFYMFLRRTLHWDLQKYTMFKSVRGVVWLAGTFIGIVILHKLLKMKETSLMFIGFFTYFISVILQGLANQDWYIYAAALIRCTSGVVSPMCRSLITKLISTDENGKIFAITVTVETLTLAFGGPIYTLLYNYTLDTTPGVFNFLTAGIFWIEIVLVIVVLFIQKKFMNAPNYTSLSVNADE